MLNQIGDLLLYPLPGVNLPALTVVTIIVIGYSMYKSRQPIESEGDKKFVRVVQISAITVAAVHVVVAILRWQGVL